MTFNFSIEEANLIIQGLAELPVKVSLALIQKIQQQAKEQEGDKNVVSDENPTT